MTYISQYTSADVTPAATDFIVSIFVALTSLAAFLAIVIVFTLLIRTVARRK